MTSPHLELETLVWLADQGIEPAESGAAGEHLRGCPDCRERMEEIEETLGDYDRFHREVLKPSLAPPPMAWAELQFPARRGRVARPLYWLAAAAAVFAVVFLLIRRFETVPEVSAAELLRQASAVEQPGATARARIRIRSGAREAIRGARDPGDAAGLRDLFESAGYRWDDPLSASAFSEWRDRQPQKQDRVTQQGGEWLLRTSSGSGALAEAALRLRASDLHPVACTLRFRASGETIEMTELAPDGASAPPAAQVRTPSQAPAPAPAAAVATPADELRVVAALHGIGADLGEPIEIRRDAGAVVVEVMGLDQGRRDQIRAALAGIAGVQLTFQEIRAGDLPSPAALSRTAPPPQRANPLLPPDLADQMIDATDKASERAFALRSLARRFPAGVATQLSPADAATLDGLVRDHAAALAASLDQIRRTLAPILPAVPSGSSQGDWHAVAEGLPAEIEQLDRELNGATDASAARKARIASGIAKLEGMAQGLRNR